MRRNRRCTTQYSYSGNLLWLCRWLVKLGTSSPLSFQQWKTNWVILISRAGERDSRLVCLKTLCSFFPHWSPKAEDCSVPSQRNPQQYLQRSQKKLKKQWELLSLPFLPLTMTPGPEVRHIHLFCHCSEQICQPKQQLILFCCSPGRAGQRWSSNAECCRNRALPP